MPNKSEMEVLPKCKKNGIPMLESHLPLAWQLPDEWKAEDGLDLVTIDASGDKESDEGEDEGAEDRALPHVDIVRAIVVDLHTGRVALVFNKPSGKRKSGWGLPGGVARDGQSPYQAWMWHERYEIPWPTVGHPTPSRTEHSRREDRIEHIHFFLVFCDGSKRRPIMPREALDIGGALLVNADEVLVRRDLWPFVNSMAASRPMEDQAIFWTHHGFLQRYWRHYQWLLRQEKMQKKIAILRASIQ